MFYQSKNEGREARSGCGIVADASFLRNSCEPERKGSLLVSRNLIDAQERGLGNIARELHDDICQRLAMLSFKIEKVAKSWATGQVQIGDQLEHIWQQCNVLTGHVQALSHELHPSILDNLGLCTALKSLCREVSERSGAVVEFSAKNVPTSLAREVSLSIFRVVQEALHNAVKYSGGDGFFVSLHANAVELDLEVRDHGVGFDVTSVASRGGLGLISMRERVELLNGTIEIESKPSRGTRIRARVPLRTETSALTAAN
jgi:signal transduction histidine kinase